MSAKETSKCHIGEYIKQKRNEKGWSQEKLAEECNVSQRTVSNWENSPDLIQKGENILNLSKAFEISPACIVVGRNLEGLDSETMKILDKQIMELFEKVGDVRNVTITIEDRGILSLEIGFTAMGMAAVALALGSYAVSDHSIFILIVCLFLGILGVAFPIFGDRIVKKLEEQLRERKGK